VAGRSPRARGSRGRAGAGGPVERVCIVGAGVIGSLFAGHLARECETTVLCRREDHATALNEHGLRVTGRHEFHSSVRAATRPETLPEPDLAIVAVKTTELASAAERLAGRWPGAAIMTVQNGLGAEDEFVSRGPWRLISAVTFMSGTKHSDTEVEYILDTETWLGPYGATPYELVEEFANLLLGAELKARAFRDLRPAQWSKLIFNATVNSVAALTELPHDPHFAARDRTEDLGHLVYDLIDEGKRVASAAGVELHEDPWEMNVHATQRGSRHYPSMLEDVQARRPTEVDQISGALVLEAERLGVPVPLHTALWRLVKAREASWPTKPSTSP
jgi:2-dehydropantoate 2-reductase